MSVLPAFGLHRPTSVDEAIDLISPEDLPYAGGTELLLVLRQRLLQPRSLVSLRAIPKLGTISIDREAAQIGATVTHRSAAQHDGLHKELPILREVLTRVGNPRVQAAGTLAGNLCFAEPKSDVIPLLIALEASVELAGPGGTRRVLVEDFVVGPYTTIREPEELLTCIRIPLVDNRLTAYVKFQTMERPTVGIAAARFGNGRNADRLRLVVGAAAATPFVIDRPYEGVVPDDIAHDITPIPDLTGSADFKRHVTAVYAGRVLAKLQVGDD